MIRYTVEEESPFTVNIYNTETNPDVPFIYQPHDEQGVDWSSKEAAIAWAEEFLVHFEEAKNQVITPQDVVMAKLAQVGLSVDELKSVLGLS